MTADGQPITNYEPGALVFAKLKGYPWWPARVEKDTQVPPRVLKQKAKSKPLITVQFFGTQDYGFFGSEAIRPFHPELVKRDFHANKFRAKNLKDAVRQALDSSVADSLPSQRNSFHSEDHGEETTNTRRSQKHTSEKSTPSSIRVIVSHGRSSRLKRQKRDFNIMEKDGQECEASTVIPSGEKPVSPITIEETLTRLKKQRPNPKTQEEPNTTLKTGPEDQSDFKKVYHIRHRLQKLVYGKKQGDIAEQDYPEISDIVKDIEQAPMTYNLLRDTKIARVVKAACTYIYENDHGYSIRERCQQLMRKWKSLFVDNDVCRVQAIHAPSETKASTSTSACQESQTTCQQIQETAQPAPP
ncbi:uncharacterized protein BYT42DRAFT_557070 [Radiomyces spectabilis]|uniref:uncharacterized protein n=1 Tax=Radiomyces spectabilis TaxID=64574 RepID=UPI00221F0AE2|nr:uncharacterized protein BYT42DRAFT_557070 [Radiomyces spectabilis]KAI8391500.1 hypothetical protein BYT42DRAFT_557070 [Radiomyces spectabilis]